MSKLQEITEETFTEGADFSRCKECGAIEGGYTYIYPLGSDFYICDRCKSKITIWGTDRIKALIGWTPRD